MNSDWLTEVPPPSDRRDEMRVWAVIERHRQSGETMFASWTVLQLVGIEDKSVDEGCYGPFDLPAD